MVTEEISTPSSRREVRENCPSSSPPIFPKYFVLTPQRLRATMAVATWPPPCLENLRILIFEFCAGNSGTTQRKSTELSPIPTTSKGLYFGKGRLNRMSSFYKLLPLFSRDSLQGVTLWRNFYGIIHITSITFHQKL